MGVYFVNCMDNSNSCKMKYLKSASALTILIVCTSFITHSQVIQLKFTATDNGTHVNIDSVIVTNLTHPASKALYWPDTTLFLGYIGINDLVDNDLFRFEINLASENPFTDRATIQISIPASSEVYIKITDVSGRLVQSGSKYLQKGRHEYLYIPDKQGIYFVSASFKSEIKTIKISCIRSERISNILEYIGFTASSKSPKSTKEGSDFVFFDNDILLINGWYQGHDTSLYIAPQNSSVNIFNFHTDKSCPGLQYINYGGQIYHTVQIGNQCWLKENLDIGTMVTSVHTDVTHSNCSNNGIIEKYCYDNDPINCEIWGGLYDWDEMMQYITTPGTKGICPYGWHIPTAGDLLALSYYLGNNVTSGGKLKEVGIVSWSPPNTGATNESGFTALGTGLRTDNGDFGFKLGLGYMWSSTLYVIVTSAKYRGFQYSSTSFIESEKHRASGLPVRCIKD